MEMKTTIKGIFSLSWLIICVTICVVIFMGRENAEIYFDNKLKLKTNPFFNGGEVIRTIKSENYTTTIHEPLYQGYLIRSKYGYIHMEWSWPKEPPKEINREYDLDGDNINDIKINLDVKNNKIIWESLNDMVLGPMVTNSILTYMRVGKDSDITVYNLNNKRAVKIMIKKGFAESYYNKKIYKR